MAQQAIEHVEDDDRPRIADMGEVVDRRPAHIHAHVLRIDRREDFLLARKRIVERESHLFPFCVMAGLVPAIHDFPTEKYTRGCPEQVRA